MQCSTGGSGPTTISIGGDSPWVDVRKEVTSYMTWSTMAPHGLRAVTEGVDAALRRNRMEVLRTVAAMRANEEEFGGAKRSRLLASSPHEVHLPYCGPRKALYPHKVTGRYKTMEDLTESSPTKAPGTHRSSRAAACAASSFLAAEEAGSGMMVRSDPRNAVAEKYRAAVEVVKPQIPVRVERSLQNHRRLLGAVRPYGLSRRTKQREKRLVFLPDVDSNEHYIDRLQCCRPSKGLYVYYE
ncbi:hypothetical protein ABL78_5745 [Leptomonas seymouri]|uniref:Uncharacterized protein n=1 Tax=Leptomonas seymouri TaxID=5684 RepID=A0A0N1IJK2_LEPSE|nr:hypothetical protein ABL78_5745 [Leptomonas seymouri]|eukprot:KPI85200.1 hypothetical protein ABL78_5745 [Leptomonas seymouri]